MSSDPSGGGKAVIVVSQLNSRLKKSISSQFFRVWVPRPHCQNQAKLLQSNACKDRAEPGSRQGLFALFCESVTCLQHSLSAGQVRAARHPLAASGPWNSSGSSACAQVLPAHGSLKLSFGSMEAKCPPVECPNIAMFVSLLPHHTQTTSCHDSREDDAVV